MDREHLTQAEIESFTLGKLDGERNQAVTAHILKCGSCREQQSRFAMTSILESIQNIAEHNQQWTCSDLFWSQPYPYARVAAPPSAEQLRQWELERGLKLPAELFRALQSQNGGCISGTDIVICPLDEFCFLSDSKWDDIFRSESDRLQRGKLLYIGFENQRAAGVVLNYSERSEPSVLYLWHDMGGELEEEAPSFDAMLESPERAR